MITSFKGDGIDELPAGLLVQTHPRTGRAKLTIAV